jgi:putative membrane protein
MGMQMDMDMQMGGFMAGWMVLWGLLAVALLILAVVGTVWLVKNLTSDKPRAGQPWDEELRRRYAAGEIDRDEFLRRQQDLATP